MMKAWMTENYEDSLVCKEIPIPIITEIDQILIKVKATSMNPIDTRMTGGYGDRLLTTLSQIKSKSFNPPPRLPLITGRDCCGEVVAFGENVKNIKIGDEVIAVIPGHFQGAHAEYVLTTVDSVARKPSNVTYLEAATLPYVACTSWAALVSVARINPNDASGNRVLIHGGSGGVGSAAIQMLKAWGAEKVLATCSAKNMNYVSSLGGIPIDYNDPNVKNILTEEGPFDVILDCVDTNLTRWSDTVMKKWSNSVHVSVLSPVLLDTDNYGIFIGLCSIAAKYFYRSLASMLNGRWFAYSFFKPNLQCLEQLTDFIENGKIKIPHIEKVYKFSDMPEAYDRCSQFHTRGKIIIDVANEKN